jgi:tight adherence protein C
MSASVLGVSLLVLVAAAVAAALVASEFLDRQARRQTLAKLDSYEWTDERDRVLAEGWKTRLALPLVQSVTDRIRRFTPDGFREKAARKLAAAGMNGEDQLDRFLALRIGALVAILPAALAVLSAFGTDKTGLLITGLVVMMLALGPTTMISRKAEERQNAIARALPDVLDLLVISIEAGLGFEQALERTVQAVPGPLSDEFSLMLGEVRAGARRADALRAMSMRVDNEDVRGFVMAVLQADTFGVSIGRMLRNQADEIRVRRRQHAQEKAQKAPVKMLIPMVFCIFPAILVIILGPAILNISQNFGKKD